MAEEQKISMSISELLLSLYAGNAKNLRVTNDDAIKVMQEISSDYPSVKYSIESIGGYTTFNIIK